MNNFFRQAVWPTIFLGVSLFLVPTIADLVGNNLEERSSILQAVASSSSMLQLIGLIITVISGLCLFLPVLKESKSRRLLQKANTIDDIWNIESLEYHTKMMFYKVQAALKSKDTDLLKNYATLEFTVDFEKEITRYSASEKTVKEISETRIICCRDFLNDEKDKFVGYLKGNIILQNRHPQVLDGDYAESYHFIRSKNGWLLDKIEDGHIFNLLSYFNKHEM